MASEIKVDTISEKTSAGGVTIDGLLIKDGGISGDVSLIGTTPTFTIGDAGAEDAALVFDGNAKDFYIALDDSADKLVIGEGSTVGTNSILTITDDSVTIGDAAAVDTKIVFDGNAQDYYIALDDSADDLLIGKGSTVGTTPAISIDSDLKVNIPVTTASTSASTGSLITGGGMGVGADLYVGDDTYLITDSAVLGFGADKDTTLTHTDGTGLTLNSTNKLCFNDASQFVQGSSNAILSLGATDEIDLTATAVDLNGTLDVSGNSQFSGTITVGVDNTGLDVKFFGATASSYMLWDESADALNLVASTLGVGAVGVKDLGTGLHIKHSDTGASVGSAADLVLENNGSVTGITLLGNASSGNAVIKFGDSGDNDAGGISYDLASDIMYQDTNNATAVTISASQVASGDFNDTSDVALKENIQTISTAIDMVKQLRPVTFDWKKENKGSASGFIAQEVELLLPNDVKGDAYDEANPKNIGKALNATGILAHVTKALQEAITKIETLEAKVAVLEG